VSDTHLFWFHCGRCGSLFQSAAGDPEKRVCPHCGADPSPGIQEPAAQTFLPPAGETTQIASDSTASGSRSKRSTRKRKNRHFMLKLISGWTLALLLIFLGVRKIWPPEDPAPKDQPTFAAKTAPAPNEDEVFLLHRAGPKCSETFASFLSAGALEQRNQFVLSPVSTASRMARFYSLNPIINIEPGKLSLSGSGLVRTPLGSAFEAQWESSDGKSLDAVFREENGEWRLDWEHFVRYGDYPWSLFLAGSGPDEGEFRLLARERLAEERKEADKISLVLYAPRFGQPRDAGFQSPEFLVSRNHRDGQLLDAAFKLARYGGRVFGNTLPEINPDGMIRVRVKVRRTESEMERKFEITGVVACHWYSVNHPGLDLPVEPAALKATGN
jgi:hypothetical protein